MASVPEIVTLFLTVDTQGVLNPWRPTCHREPSPVALPSLPTVFVLSNAAVGRESVFLLHVRDVQPTM